MPDCALDTSSTPTLLPLRLIDWSFSDPAENLALDEVLLDGADAHESGSVLRLWESPVRFVVLGTGQVIADEVYEESCALHGIPVLRRRTAGGCVLQGPGSLNYALALRFDEFPEVRTLRASYCFLLGRLCAAFRAVGLDVRHEGISDLALGGFKVSGNAQRRKKHAILHHGTLLHRADHATMCACLREPAVRPDYRAARTHDSFVRALPLEAAALRTAVRHAFPAVPSALTPEELARTAELARTRYADPAWTRRR